MKSKMNDDAMSELYRDDPELALQLINSILQDGDQSELLIVLRQLAKVVSGAQTVADMTQRP